MKGVKGTVAATVCLWTAAGSPFPFHSWLGAGEQPSVLRQLGTEGGSGGETDASVPVFSDDLRISLTMPDSEEGDAPLNPDLRFFLRLPGDFSELQNVNSSCVAVVGGGGGLMVEGGDVIEDEGERETGKDGEVEEEKEMSSSARRRRERASGDLEALLEENENLCLSAFEGFTGDGDGGLEGKVESEVTPQPGPFRFIFCTPTSEVSHLERFLAFRLPVPDYKRLSEVGRSRNTFVDGEGGLSAPTVCFRESPTSPPKKAALLDLHVAPSAKEAPTASNRVAVRVFLNPGWEREVTLRMRNATASVILSLKEPKEGCRGFFDDNAFHWSYASQIVQHDFAEGEDEVPETPDPAAAAQSEGEKEKGTGRTGQAEMRRALEGNETETPADLPGTGGTEPNSTSNESLPLSSPGGLPSVFSNFSSLWLFRKLDQDVSFPLAADYRHKPEVLKAWKDRVQRNAPLQLCVYSDESLYNGTHIGDAQLGIDKGDSAELVGFIMFFIMGLPFFCGSALACYNYKHRRLRFRMRRFHLIRQQIDIERRLTEELGLQST
uniref:Transmembrane protein n=1 Tax=Chromera velia CCMP2878 TaxID=1169474 RepID=A0A0G4HDK3_9ALVE|eukprot:Cvel_26540.t1-p1 / transcript=Cvel_26540.t1 / gene=Cvel_26540 / organism=Chromera_velia_CCMP2878 / gene_product=hypothetical protein / transcript_product=hypothetical protein / location=Cvel_scaffold3174:12107-15370(-) / protein_length=550 / sequence_SO=supercontig / SO=protein_coding / is_pseudo=false